MAVTKITVTCQENDRSIKNLGIWVEVLRFCGIFPITKEGKFSKALWYRSVVITIVLMLFILPVEVYNYCIKLRFRISSSYMLLQATMNTSTKFVGISMLISHVRATRKYREKLEAVAQHLIKYRYRKLDSAASMVILWSLTKHIIFTYYRTSAANFASFADVAHYIRSRLIYVLFLLTRIALSHIYSSLLHYHIQRFQKLVQSVQSKKSPDTAILHHSYLIHLTHSIHACFSLPLLLLVIDSTYLLIINTYFVSSLITVPNNKDINFDKISERVFSFGALLYYSMGPLNRCMKTINVAEAFNNELFKLMRDSKDLCSNSKLRLYVTMKQTVNFTACGFFSLGYPLVTSIIAAATTYLVILIQFSLLTS